MDDAASKYKFKKTLENEVKIIISNLSARLEGAILPARWFLKECIQMLIHVWLSFMCKISKCNVFDNPSNTNVMLQV